MNKVLAILLVAVPMSFAAQTAAPTPAPADQPVTKTAKKHVKKVKKTKVQKSATTAPVTNNAVPAKQ